MNPVTFIRLYPVLIGMLLALSLAALAEWLDAGG